jgi:CubicO group peptidase (beta-lactamase class C family)
MSRVAIRWAVHASMTAMLLATPTAGLTQAAPPQPENDPVKLGTMAGFPPAPDKVVSRANILKPQNSRWAFRHLRQLYPTRAVERADRVRPLPRAAQRDMGAVQFLAAGGERLSIAEWQRRTNTDALVVLQGGRILYENYAPGMTGRTQHALWSMSKSMVGLLAMMAVEEGRLDPARPVTEYLPELEGTGWQDAAVAHALDMQTSIAYRETFSDPGADIFRYLFAAGLLVPPPNLPVSENLYRYLATIKATGSHGGAFEYKSVDTEVVSWILQRIYDKPLSELLADRIWSKIGAQDEAYYIVDPHGIDIGSVGLAASALDLARLGQALADGVNGKGQLVRRETLAPLYDASTRDAFAQSAQASVRQGYSYRNQWWMPNDADRTIEAKGLFGQHLVVNPAKNIVIVKLSTNPPGDTILTHALDKAAFAALVAQAAR